MKLNKQFNPLFFQASLAAGGVALMPFNFLQFAVPHGKGLIQLSGILWTELSQIQMALYSVLVAVMFIAIIVHAFFTAVFLKSMIEWIIDRKAPAELINDPYKNVTIFPIVGSLAMSANVFWAPVGFFIPQVAEGLQSLMLPSLIYFVILWGALFILEWKVIKVWFMKSVETDKFNFIWLLDVFAFGLVSLTGSGIASTSTNPQIATFAFAGTVLTVVIGLIMLAVKLVFLIASLIKTKKLPDNPILPAFFVVVPIACLYGLSLFRLVSYFQKSLGIDISKISSAVMNSSYAIAIVWIACTLYLLGHYFKNHFLKSNYSAPQWSIVCAIVGSQVLGVYVQGLYIHKFYLAVLNYFSVILAVIAYSLILIKFFKSLAPVKS